MGILPGVAIFSSCPWGGSIPRAKFRTNRTKTAACLKTSTRPDTLIDELYLNNPYYIAPDGEVGHQAFAVIRETIRKEGMVAIGKVVFTSREHIIALEPRSKGLLGITLLYPYAIAS